MDEKVRVFVGNSLGRKKLFVLNNVRGTLECLTERDNIATEAWDYLERYLPPLSEKEKEAINKFRGVRV